MPFFYFNMYTQKFTKILYKHERISTQKISMHICIIIFVNENSTHATFCALNKYTSLKSRLFWFLLENLRGKSFAM